MCSGRKVPTGREPSTGYTCSRKRRPSSLRVIGLEVLASNHFSAYCRKVIRTD